MPDTHHIFLESTVPESLDNARFDQVVAQIFDSYSRSRIQQWIKEGQITLDGKQVKPKEKAFVGQVICLDVHVAPLTDTEEAQPVDFEIVHEDDSLMVVNKPAGLVVHPAAGHAKNTLLNGLLHHCEQLHNLPRAGIVHRLDKETSGLMVVAKTLEAHHDLVAQLQARTVSRHYFALVQGQMTAGGTVETLMGRHPVHRKKQAVLEEQGKIAITHYRVETRFPAHTLIRCQLETGRTHQIRVHMAHLGYPLLGDKLYGGRPRLPKGASPEFVAALQSFSRQALHAFRLGLDHPETGEPVEWFADMPEDITQLVAQCGEDAKGRQP